MSKAPSTDPYLQQTVAFPLAGPEGAVISQLFSGEIPDEAKDFCLNTGGHLVGTVIERSKGKNSEKYEVEWESTLLSRATIHVRYLLSAIKDGERLLASRRTSRVDHTPSNGRPLQRLEILMEKLMNRTDDEDMGPPILSHVDDDDGVNSEDDEASHSSTDEYCSGNISWLPREKRPPIHVDEEYPIFNSEHRNNLIWKRDIEIPDNPGVIVRETAFLPGAKECFSSPLSSFLAFIPMIFWETLAYESNKYAEQKMAVSGSRTIAGHYLGGHAEWQSRKASEW